MFSTSYNTRSSTPGQAFKPKKKLFFQDDPNSIFPDVLEEKENLKVISSEKSCIDEYNSPVVTRDALDKVFDQFDELYSKATLLTPRPKLTPYKFLLSPEKLCSPSLTMGPFNLTPISARVNKNDNSFDSLKKPFNTKQKKVNFNCSTPKSYSHIEDFKTPTNSTNLMCTPVSGIKPLTYDDKSAINTSVSEAKQLTFGDNSVKLVTEDHITPKSACSMSTFTNLSSTSINLSPAKKEKLLDGVVCYVDCRVEKQEASEVVKIELLSLGARVEKNFTKKVTHVVFKEGRRWVYLKAKKEGVPIVGVLWIEACKSIQGIADVEKHPPKDMKKFHQILPYQTIKETRIPILNPNSKVRRNLLLLSELFPIDAESDDEKRPNKALTEAKKKFKQKIGEYNCIKDLFDDFGSFGISPKVVKRNIPSTIKKENRYLSNLDNIHRIDKIVCRKRDNSKVRSLDRRKSAPGKLFTKKYSRKEDIKEYLLKPQNNDILEGNNSKVKEPDSLEKNFQNDVFTTGEQEIVKKSTAVKKKKLLDPNECFLHTIQNETNSVQNSGTDVEMPCTPKRAKTKATYRSTILKLAISRKLQERRRMKPEVADMDESSPSSVFYVEKSESNCKAKLQQQQPTVVFTSVPKNELPKYIDMVNKLGKWAIQEKVTKCTTHVISNGPRRTINLIKGIARGCWLVDLKWVIESINIGKWLPEESYDLSSHFPAAQDCCKERRSLKSSRVIDIFKEAGCIYVSRKSAPRFSDLEELLRICSANLTSSSEKADIKVGGKVHTKSSAKHVLERWVLDSITRNCLLPLDGYLINTLSPDTTFTKGPVNCQFKIME